MACETLLNTGRTIIGSWANEDCEATPLTTATTPITSWQPLGGMQSGNENYTTRETTALVEGESLTVRESTGGDVQITFSVLDIADKALTSSQQELRNLVIAAELNQPVTTPKVWVRIWDTAIGDNGEYRYYYCKVTPPTRSFDLEGNRTAEFTFDAVPTNQPSNPPFQTEPVPES